MKARVWGWMALGSLLVGCATAPQPADNLPPPLVLRTADSTTWSTAEAEAAAAAAAIEARRPGARGTLAPAPRPGPAVGTASAGAAAVAPAAAASAAAAPPAPPRPPAVDAGPPARLIHFDFDSYDIKAEFSAAIEAHARALGGDRSRKLVIEGHADERGGAEYNLALGQKRAQAIVKALLLLGANDGQLEAVSFGDTRPLASGRSEEAWARNRRAEIKDR